MAERAEGAKQTAEPRPAAQGLIGLEGQALEQLPAVNTAARAASRPRAASPSQILSLQRAAGNRATAGLLQRDPDPPERRVRVRSPVFEETVTQISDISSAISGRPLTAREAALAEPIFGASLDTTRVRLIPTRVLEYRTVGNNIRVPENFTIRNAEMAQILIHELAHVWQYQHTGTSYLSESLSDQIVATISTGSRNTAYDYRLTGTSRFFDFRVEQQALIVENTFAMRRDQVASPDQAVFRSNHMDARGNFSPLTYEQRRAEIAAELPHHERLLGQMRRALPRPEVDVVQQRAQDIMRTPGMGLPSRRPEEEMAPTRPLLEVRF